MLPYAERLNRLDCLLAAHDGLWRPQPFKEARPAWCARLPELAAELLALDDAALADLSGDSAALLRYLSRHLPALGELGELTDLPPRDGPPLTLPSPWLQWEIPGRKWTQIESFVQAVGAVRAPLLEWCGGKGHLGRLIGAVHGVAVDTIDIDADMCDEGRRLSQRAQVEQTFVAADALGDDAATRLAGRHAVALHACGDLHRSLVRQSIARGVTALDFAPCCYYRTTDKIYRPWSHSAKLELSRDDLRLAVTETVTSAPREVRHRDREMAWKLGFDLLRREVLGTDRYLPFKPVAKPWLRLDFQGFCRALAKREGLALPATLDWDRYERAGWQRQREVMRLSLVRSVFRRPLEVWLVLDLACHLEEHGYRVDLGTFCLRHVTPRNILLSARA